MSVADRILPHNLEAERSILGAVIVDPSAMDVLGDQVAPEMFYRKAHEHIFRAELALYERDEPIEFVTLKEELARRQLLDDVGGPSYIASLADGTPRGVNLPYYAAIVRDKSQARAVIALANRLLSSAYAPNTTPQRLIDEAENGLLGLSESATPGDLVWADDLVTRFLPTLYATWETQQGVTGMATGFPQLDGFTRGMQPGNLWILGARPSQGKTSLGTQIAMHVSRESTVAFFSLEMSQTEQMWRISAALSQVDGLELQTGQVNYILKDRVGAALNEFANRRFAMDDSGSLSALQLKSKAKRLKKRRGLGLIVVDYLQLMVHPKGDSREERVGATGKLLKMIAKELQVPVLALCQLSRAVEQRQDQTPRLSDLRESGSLEQDADVVLLMHRKADQNVPTTELIIAKQRNGPTATVSMTWNRSEYRFEERPSV